MDTTNKLMTPQTLPKTEKLSPAIATTDKSKTDPFDNAHLMADIKGHSVRGGAVNVGAQGIKFVLHTVSTAILARLLTPADFGLIMMVAAFTEFVNLFKDLGLSTATIQRKDVNHRQVSTLFWVNVALSCLLIGITAAISPLVAWFYGEPRLTRITIAIGSTFIFGGLIAQHTALMRRQMRFCALAVIEIVAMTASTVAAVIAALLGLSYWSLVILMVVRGFVSVVMVWWQSPWRPGRPLRGSGVRSMLAFGGNLTGANVLNHFTRNADNVIIGYVLGGAALGMYSKAYHLLMLPLSQLNMPFNTIMIPVLSRLQDEPQRYRRYYLQIIAGLAAMTMPLVAFLFATADEVIYIVLGSQWSAAAGVFRYLAPAAFLTSIGFAPSWLCVSLGRARVQFRWTMLSAPVIVAGFLIGIHWGINGVAASFSITWSAMFLLFVYWTTRHSPVRFRDIVQALAVPVVSSLFAGIAVVLTVTVMAESTAIARIGVGALTFAACYFGCLGATAKGRELIHSMISALSALRSKPDIATITR